MNSFWKGFLGRALPKPERVSVARDQQARDQQAKLTSLYKAGQRTRNGLGGALVLGGIGSVAYLNTGRDQSSANPPAIIDTQDACAGIPADRASNTLREIPSNPETTLGTTCDGYAVLGGFVQGSSTLSAQQIALLQEWAKGSLQCSTIYIGGGVSQEGSPSFNSRLAEQRAVNTVKQLQSFISGAKFTTGDLSQLTLVGPDGEKAPDAKVPDAKVPDAVQRNVRFACLAWP